MKPAEIGAGIIREVRRKLGIDRPSALAWARNLLAKAPTTEARVVIEGVAEKFGLRSDHDVTRLRPKESRRRGRTGEKAGRPAAGRGAAARGRRRRAEEGAREGREGSRAGGRAGAGEGRGLGHLPGAREPGGPGPVLPSSRRPSDTSAG